MWRLLRIGAWTAGGLLAILSIATGTLVLGIDTGAGHALLGRAVGWWTHAEVEISVTSVTFPTAIDLKRLVASDSQGNWLVAERVSVHWSPRDLLDRRIRIDRLQIGRLQWLRLPVIRRAQGGSALRGFGIDAAGVAVDEFVVSSPLVQSQARLTLRGSGRWQSADDVLLSVIADRLDSAGRYALGLRVMPHGYDAQLDLREPQGGLLQSIARVPQLGALTVRARMTGPLAASRVEISAEAGELRGGLHGTIDFVGHSADLDYELQAPAMAPRPDLTWRRVQLQGSLRGLWARPLARGALQIDGLATPGDFRLATLNADLHAQDGRIAADATAYRVTVPGPRPKLLQTSPIRLHAQMQTDSPERSLVVTASHPLFAIALRSTGGAAREAAFDLQLFDLGPLAELSRQAIRGSAVVTGQVALGAATRLALTARAHIIGVTAWKPLLGPAPQLQLAAVLTDNLLRVERLVLLGRAASLSLTGSIERRPTGWNPALTALHASGDLAVPDVAVLSAAASGSLNLHGRWDGPWNSAVVRVDALSKLSVGRVPLGPVRAVYQARGPAGAGHATLQVSAMLDSEPLTIDASLDRDRDAGLRATITHSGWKSAQLTGDIAMGGRHAAAEGDLQLRLGRLADIQRLPGILLDGGAGAKLTLRSSGGRSRAHLEMDTTDLAINGFAGTVRMTADGFPEALRVRLRLTDALLGGGPVALQAAGRLDLAARHLDLGRLELNYHGESARLREPARLAFDDGITIDPLELGIRNTVLRVRGSVIPILNLQASVLHLDAGLLNVFLPFALGRGHLDAEAELTGSIAMPRGSMRIAAQDVRFAGRIADDVPALAARGSVLLQDGAARIDMKLEGGKDLDVSVAGTVPLRPDAPWDLRGNGRLEVEFLDPLLETYGVQAAGALTLDLALQGKLRTPAVAGHLDLTHGDLRAYAQGIHLSDISARVSGHDGIVDVQALTAQAGEGTISVTGLIDVAQAGAPLDLHVVAQNATALGSDILNATLDADLHVSGQPTKRITTSGSILVRNADVSIPKNFPPNVAVLDVRGRGASVPVAPRQPLGASIDIAVSAPRQIHIHGRGIDAEMGGELHLRGPVATPQVTGGFELLRGSIALAGSHLKFSSGRIGFSGSGPGGSLDPSLDFTAESTIGETTCRLQVVGSVDSPQLRLSSVPQLPQEEILARLLFAQSTSQLSALQAARIGGALVTFSGLRDAGPNLLGKLQTTLELDTLEVSTMDTSTQKSAVTVEAGRYVWDRVYVAGKSIAGGGFQLGVDFEVNRNLKLQTRLGDNSATAQGVNPQNDPGSSVGVAYQIEY